MNGIQSIRAKRMMWLSAVGASLACALAILSLLPGVALASAPSFGLYAQRSAGAGAIGLTGALHPGAVSLTTDGLTVHTLEPLSLTATEVLLGGYIEPADETTHVKFEVGLESGTWCSTGGAAGSPGSTSPWYELKSIEKPVIAGVYLSNLSAGSEYCYEVIAEDASGTSRGGQVSFVAGAPAASTAEARATGPGTATVEGEIDPASQSTEYWVDYGRAGSRWCETEGVSGAPEGSSAHAVLGFVDEEFHEVDANLNGLASNAKYCAGLMAQNRSGVSRGEQVSFESAEANYTLAVTIAGAGAGTVSGGDIACSASTCTSLVAGGTHVTLTAVPASGSTFTGWSGACSGSGVCEVTMNAAEGVTATFAVSPPSGGGTPGGGSSGGNSGSSAPGGGSGSANGTSTATPQQEVEPAKESSSLLLAASKITVQSSGEALIDVQCRGDALCSGTLTLTAREQVDAGGRKKTRTITIGVFTCSIPAGKAETVKVKLSKAARGMLARDHGRIAARLVVLGASGTAPSHPSGTAVTLIAQAKQKRK